MGVIVRKSNDAFVHSICMKRGARTSRHMRCLGSKAMTRTTRRHSRLRMGLALMALGFGALGLAGPAVGSDGTEFACEEAVAHLVDCCPGFDPTRVYCDHSLGGCDGSPPQGPDVSKTTGKCLRAQSCAQLQTKGYCSPTKNWETVQCL